MRKLILTVLCVIFTSNLIFSQQIPLFSQYYLNNFFYNPAKAGSSNNTQAYLLLRKQWVDIPNSPESALLTFETPIKPKKVGLGLTFYNDLLHIIGKTGVFGTYSYSFNLANDQLLSFGISAGINQNKIFYDRIKTDDITELSWLNNLDTKAKIDGNFGINYSKNKFEIGVSCFQLLNSSFNFKSDTYGNEIDYKLIRHYFGTVKYSIAPKNWNGFHIDPMILIRTAEGMPIQFEGNLIFNYKNRAWIGAMYRQNFGLSFLGGIMLNEKLTVGYSYDYSLGDISKYSGGTHEIVIGYKFLHKSAGTIQPLTNGDQEKFEKSLQDQHEQIVQLEYKDKKLIQDIENKDKKLKELTEEVEKLRLANKPNEDQIKQLIQKYSTDFSKIDTHLTGKGTKQVIVYQQDTNTRIIKDELKTMKVEIEKVKLASKPDDKAINEMIKTNIPNFIKTDTQLGGKISQQIIVYKQDTSRFKGLDNQINDIKNEIEKLKLTKNEINNTELENQIKSIKDEIEKLKLNNNVANNKALIDQINNIKTEIETLKINKNKGDNKEVSNKINTIKAEIDKNINDSKVHNGQIKNLKSEIERIKVEKNLTDNEVKELMQMYNTDYVKTDNKVDTKSPTQKPGNYYVVVGSYFSEYFAKLGQEILMKSLSINTNIIPRVINNVTYYTLYTKKVTSYPEFKEEFDRLNSMNIKFYITGNVWLMDGNK